MIVPLATLAALLGGAACCLLVVRRPVAVPVLTVDPQPVERAIWSRSARELYRTVVGVVDDLDVGLLTPPGGTDTPPGGTDTSGDTPADAGPDTDPDAAVDPTAARACLQGAVTRARGSATWALALSEQALGQDAERACDHVAAGMAALADAASAALADPADVDRARRVHAVRERVRGEAQHLVRLL